MKTLFLGLEELAPLLEAGTKLAFLRATAGAELADYPQAKSQWLFEQSFAPYADGLRAAGYPVTPEPAHAENSMDRVLYIATRFAEENHATLARAWKMLKPGGMLVAAQHNDLGAKRLDGMLKSLAGERQSLSKHHCRAVAVTKPAATDAATAKRLQEWETADAARRVTDTPLYAAPGMFSWRKVDAGSRLLVEALPKRLAGKGGDIAAGWGYLSWALLEQYPDIRHITLYEAEKRALDMAARNLADKADKTRFIWCDATRPLDTQGAPLDWVVMNPPAHDMLWSAPEASAAMCARVAEALKQGGKLWMVANRHLPYERTLEGLFASQSVLRETGDFKVIEAVK